MKRNYSVSELLLVLAAVPVGMLLSALAVQACWGFFVVPLGAPEIGMVHGLGMITALRYMTGATASTGKTATHIHVAVKTVIEPVIIIAMAYVLHWMM